MCEECGCGHTHEKRQQEEDETIVRINRSVTETNDTIALQISTFLKEKGILSVNIMGSPGSGKTTIIEHVAEELGPKNIMVIQGDLESDVDTERLAERGIDCYQINTHSGCHLNAAMINRAFYEIAFNKKKYLLVENVGNLVCPADIQIGQHMDIVISSTTEGSDKPKKYPKIFMNADMIVISKSDIANAVGFDKERYTRDLKEINPKAPIIMTGKEEKEGYHKIAHELEHEREHLLGHEHTHHHHDHK